MSCNGCRVLRKGCSENCILQPCLQWIQTPEAQGHATVFVAKFFGRAGLMSFISAVPHPQRPALFQSLLFEAAGRTVNPVNGAVGLLSTGNWHICQAAVETVLRGGALRPLTDLELSSSECTDIFKLRDSTSTCRLRVEKRRRPYEPEMKMPDPTDLNLSQALPAKNIITDEKRRSETPSRISEESVTTSCYESGNGLREIKLLNLF